MGACASASLNLHPPVKFSLSLAPTSSPNSKRTCHTCEQVIEKGALHLSRTLPPMSYLGIQLAPAVMQHFHFDHGMHAAAMVPCGKRESPPAFTYATVFGISQERRIQTASRHAVELWQARRELRKGQSRSRGESPMATMFF